MKFSKDYQPAKRGRKKVKWGAKTFDNETVTKALEALKRGLDDGESWAVMAVIDRVFPKIKPIQPKGSLEAEELQIKVGQMRELSELIEACEKIVEENEKKVG